MNYRWLALVCFFTIPTSANAKLEFAVEARLADGTKLQGFLTEPTIRFTFDGGTIDLDTAKIERLELAATKDAHDTVTAHGLRALHGHCDADSFTLLIDGQKRTFPRGEIQSIRGVQPRPVGIFSRLILPLITLTAMEIVLGIDNIIFLAIIAGRLPQHQQPRARRLGLIAALATRLGLLATLSFILSLTAPVWTLPNMPLFRELESRQISWRDIILLLGGMFLIWKSTFEIHKKIECGGEEAPTRTSGTARFGMVLVEIAIIDIIFSLDSVITAVGMVDSLAVMITAMVIAMLVMMLFAEPISRFVTRHPTLKVLALAFLILIGVLLVAEGCGQHIDKGYIYFAMAFAVGVETINLRVRRAAVSA